jgi:hypothetical protein
VERRSHRPESGKYVLVGVNSRARIHLQSPLERFVAWAHRENPESVI